MMYNDAKTNAILANPCTSFWLESAIRNLLARDPVDAARDSEVLCELMQERENAALGIKRVPTHKTWPVIFLEGGLVQSVMSITSPLATNAKATYTQPEYEVMDYDILDGNPTEEIAQYWENRTPELRAYMLEQIPDSAAPFLEAVEELKRPKPAPAREANYILELERLWDMLSDTVEGGRLTEADIPDDYQALVQQMIKLAGIEGAKDPELED